MQAQRVAAQALIGKLVIFCDNEGLNPPIRVTAAKDGMVQLSGFVGQFAPQLFTVVEEEHRAEYREEYRAQCPEAELVTGRRCRLLDGHKEDHVYA